VSSGAVGLQITIYNPDFDRGGANGRGLATTVNTVLSEFTMSAFAVISAMRG
jgi:hypothetical protein